MLTNGEPRSFKSITRGLAQRGSRGHAGAAAERNPVNQLRRGARARSAGQAPYAARYAKDPGT